MAVTIAAAVVVACLCSALTLWGLMGCRGYERPGQRRDREGQLTRPQAGLASAPHPGLPSVPSALVPAVLSGLRRPTDVATPGVAFSFGAARRQRAGLSSGLGMAGEGHRRVNGEICHDRTN
jgi:hypothetical protein